MFSFISWLDFSEVIVDCKYVAADVGHAVFLKIWALVVTLTCMNHYGGQE